ncbi:MAG: Tex-like N-terminal domain-containing protein [Planctomycetota bacterium]|nr:Tex-like N-terminal domain-containing protein [Planctomycetota bacterium]
MSVDFDAIAQRGRCDVSSLRLAVPLLEQGYSPPFLARYRRDELGAISESTLWQLLTALRAEQETEKRRNQLLETWEKTTLRDSAIGGALKNSRSLRVLNRLGRRLKGETGDSVSASTQLAVRVLNPQKGDSEDLSALASSIEGLDNVDEALSGLDAMLAERLAGDPRIIAAAVRWLSRNAKIHISKVHDPHLAVEEESQAKPKKSKKEPAAKTSTESASDQQNDSADESAGDLEPSKESLAAEATSVEVSLDSANHGGSETASEAPSVQEVETSNAAEPGIAVATSAPEQIETSDGSTTAQAESPEGSSDSVTTSVESASETEASETEAADLTAASVSESSSPESGSAAPVEEKSAAETKPVASKKQKKISPRQRRRRWLVSVLKPLSGKRFAGDKLSSFQVVMLGRALRSQVVVCSFEYDATRLVGELQRVAGAMNRHFEDKLQAIILQFEGVIREAGEAAWWDDLHEKASAKLISITAGHLEKQVNRGALDGRVVLAIDAVGPRTAATSIICSDGRILHNEDLPCQLSTALRSQTVTRLGELIHSYHVDLIVVSNGPARRATMVALGDLIGQSPEGSIRWTLADRNGADVYAGSAIADEEMKATSRRFRAAAWLGFSVLQPAQAFAKVDALKLRLSSFQRELADDQLAPTLDDVIVSGASRGGVDVNSAPVSWLTRLPGVTSGVAQAIDQARREKLFDSRESLSQLEQWGSVAGSRQALPFLRVFGSEQTLDGTLIHPDDYALAEKLASALEIELPPQNPPGYVAPDFSAPEDPTQQQQISEAPPEEAPAVEDFSNAAEQVNEFTLDEQGSSTDQEAPSTEETSSDAEDQQETSSQEESAVESSPETEVDQSSVAEESAAEESAAEESESPVAESEAGSQQASVESVESEAVLDKNSIPEPIRRTRPDAAKVDKCVKEWQVGSQRSHQLVQWLCDPFGDSDTSGNAPAVLSAIPSTKGLKAGDQVIGVVVGVMPFGVFVELAPDCSGLVHVSRITDSYVEDLHEAVQVGDVISAWVTGIDEKRRRVALSGVSPEREAELQTERQSSRANQGRGGRGSSGGNPRRGGRGGQDGRSGSDRSRGGNSQSGNSQSRDHSKRSGGRSTGSANRGDSRGGSQRRDGGGRGRGAKSGGGRRGRERKPESYGVVSKAESKPISDAMQKGEEPLRSFGDLMQFFDHSTSAKPEVTEQKDAKPAEAVPESADQQQQQDQTPAENSDSPPAPADESNNGIDPNATESGDSPKEEA